MSMIQKIFRFFFQSKPGKTNSVLGVDIFDGNPRLSNQLTILALKNVASISFLPKQDLNKIAKIIESGLRQGLTYKDVAIEIQQTVGVSEEQAQFIARNQTKKLNSDLTRLRQEEIGISEYVFQTSGDERVRPSHAIMDGKICNWSDPTVYKKKTKGKWLKRPKGATLHHPGDEENCRCVSLPVLDNFFD